LRSVWIKRKNKRHRVPKSVRHRIQWKKKGVAGGIGKKGSGNEKRQLSFRSGERIFSWEKVKLFP